MTRKRQTRSTGSSRRRRARRRHVGDCNCSMCRMGRLRQVWRIETSGKGMLGLGSRMPFHRWLEQRRESMAREKGE